MLAQKNHHAILVNFIDAEDYAASEKCQKIFICI
jgi:hypothetical protein